MACPRAWKEQPTPAAGGPGRSWERSLPRDSTLMGGQGQPLALRGRQAHTQWTHCRPPRSGGRRPGPPASPAPTGSSPAPGILGAAGRETLGRGVQGGDEQGNAGGGRLGCRSRWGVTSPCFPRHPRPGLGKQPHCQARRTSPSAQGVWGHFLVQSTQSLPPTPQNFLLLSLSGQPPRARNFPGSGEGKGPRVTCSWVRTQERKRDGT